MQVQKIGSNYNSAYVSRLEPTFNGRLPKDFYRPKHIKNFFSYKSFARYSPLKFNFGEYEIPVHNEGIAQKLKRKYTPETFSELFK